MAFNIDIVTIFPPFFQGPLQESLLKKAQEKGRVKIRVHNLRDYTQDKHKTVDDKPFGGGPGMILKPEPIFDCVEDIERSTSKAWKIILDPQGERMSQPLAEKLAKKKHLVLICGYYEGVDARVSEGLVDQQISIGDFITMGGGAPALCLIEAVVRLLPGVLGNQDSLKHETFDAGLEYPQYTRPREYRGMKVPEVLISGNHKQVEKWRQEVAHKATEKRRPDLKNKQ
jgi:tRNA (guanine37-N1)-methyltransferase